MKYQIVNPEIAGGWGENTVLANRNRHPPEISKLHYQFHGWLGDVLLESFPCYILTEEAREALDAIDATGVQYDQVEISTSEEFAALHSGELPKFLWLKVIGRPGVDDFGITPAPDLNLVVSERALQTLQGLGISHALVKAYPDQ